MKSDVPCTVNITKTCNGCSVTAMQCMDLLYHSTTRHSRTRVVCKCARATYPAGPTADADQLLQCLFSVGVVSTIRCHGSVTQYKLGMSDSAYQVSFFLPVINDTFFFHLIKLQFRGARLCNTYFLLFIWHWSDMYNQFIVTTHQQHHHTVLHAQHTTPSHYSAARTAHHTITLF